MKKYIIILITSLIISISLISLTIIDNYNKPKVTPIDDSYLAYFVDGQETNTIPEKGNYDVSITCDKGANATWDYDNWAITIYNATQTGTRCSVTFTTKKEFNDGTGAASPELFAGLIPITYDSDNNNVIVVADYTTEWYNYNNHQWANAILIDQNNTTTKNKYLNADGTYKSGTVVDIDDVLQMYVWVPRYKYKLFNVSGATTSAQMIEVEFESANTAKSNGTQNGQWLTHPAFTFGTTELNGIWVGKFKSSGTSVYDESISEITIIPNESSLGIEIIRDMFNASRAIEANAKYGLVPSEVDTHMMKNMEWGAVAYLTNSKYGRYQSDGSCISSGCEIWINNNSNFTTGCAGDSVSASRSSSCNQWNTSKGVNASTTGSIYGIYDMSGGAFERVMGNYNKRPGSSLINFGSIDSKYYDVYTGTSVSNGKLGDATKETQGWNGDVAYFVDSFGPWFIRGGSYRAATSAGVFYFDVSEGGEGAFYSWRVVLSSE